MNIGYSNEVRDNKNIIKHTELFIELLIEEDTEDILEEVYETLAITPFDKISVPVSTYKSYIDDSMDPNNNKTITVGYIRSYDDRDEVFNIVLFDKYKELANNELHIEPFYNTIYEDGITKLGTIIKLNIIIDD